MAIQQGWPKFLPLSWKRTLSCDQCLSWRACWSNACWSSSQRWARRPNAATAPLWDTTKFLNWEPSQPSKIVQAITVGLALLTTKNMDQKFCQHNFTAALWWNHGPWNALWRVERLAASHNKKKKPCPHDRGPGTLSEMENGRLSLIVGTYVKAGSSILLKMMLRPGAVLQKNIPTKDLKQRSHVWKLPMIDSSAPSVLSAPCCTTTRSFLVILGKSSLC